MLTTILVQDRDGDGKLSEDEVLSVVQSYGVWLNRKQEEEFIKSMPFQKGLIDCRVTILLYLTHQHIPPL